MGRRRLALALLGASLATPALAANTPSATTPGTTPAPATPAAATPAAAASPLKAPVDVQPDIWIFSGVLPSHREAFSGTLVSSKADAEFELKLAGGATCDGSELKGDVGLVRLSEIACTDGRSMRALFVPQGGTALKVFGHVGEDRFVAEAHLLGTEPPPERKQTAQPTAPQLQPPPGLIAPPKP